MLQVKKILNDLVEQAYADHPKKELFKKFYVEINDKIMQSKHGDYNIQTLKIRIFNLYRSDDAVIATTIHELAHHIDYMNRGTTNHRKEFYAVYKILLYKALDMKLFSKQQFLYATKDASDSNKVTKMIESYKPKDAEYKKNIKKIAVKNAFELKDELKQRGYLWNKINKTWEVEIPEEKYEEEIAWLISKNATYETVSATKLSFNRTLKYYAVALNGSYDYRTELKGDGFTYEPSTKHWRKEVKPDDIYKLMKKYPKITWMEEEKMENS